MSFNQKYTSKTSVALMFLGLIPFIATIYYLQFYNFELGLAIFIHYSAIILSFIGAINWGRTFPEKSYKIFYFSIAPSIFAFSAIFFSFPDNLIVLVVGYIFAWIIDIHLLIKFKEFHFYLLIRTIISIFVIYFHNYIM